ncbi:hypothetical protein COV18_00940 [Candidatus Woesearchaeota archaeon CG10_big_fil_rev_8_21_14_0_10_37_12]|nr:MAG: hypothetical protein COV18_00940 [Candidatus Woesearchaeota archaeon CG10_big_fil_rev_8_21_14_0_10_37_12]
MLKYRVCLRYFMAKENEVIQFIGVSDLSDADQATVNHVTMNHFDKVKRELQNITNMSIHVKTYQKEGSRQKYSLHVKVAAPTKIFDSSSSDDWDLARALHMAFEDIVKQIQHTFHSNRSRPDNK